MAKFIELHQDISDETDAQLAVTINVDRIEEVWARGNGSMIQFVGHKTGIFYNESYAFVKSALGYATDKQ